MRWWILLGLALLACAPPPSPPADGSDPGPAPTHCPDCTLDCASCPPRIQEKRVEVHVYVCPNGAEVPNASLCATPLDLELRLSARRLYLTEVEAYPACYRGEAAGEIHWKTGTFATTIEIQERGATGDYSTLYTDQGKYEGRRTFTFRPSYKASDFTLEPGRSHILRLFLVYGEGETTLGHEVSDELLVDAREGSDYLRKVCSS